MPTLQRHLCIRGYHIYNDIWTAVIGEELICQRELTNPTDAYAVAVVRSGQVIGYLPRKVSCACSIFIRREGSITCVVTGGRRYFSGLEVSCKVKFTAKKDDELKKLK
jgi:hypothetical protein